MKYWIVPSNDSTFRIADAIKANDGIVDWRQSNKFAVGDIVFIYKGHKEWQGNKDQVISSTNKKLNDLVFASDLFRKVKKVEMQEEENA